MPANRSRTERWRECLEQIKARGGGLEIVVAGPANHADARPIGSDLVWRVRVLAITRDEVQVEQPMALGQPIEVQKGTHLIASMSIGQNRWMFRTHVVDRILGPDGRMTVLRLALPESVERCQRRSFFRVSTAELHLPLVECWPIIDPTTVIAAEIANRAQVTSASTRPVSGESTDAIVLPEVGPRFLAKLLNLGGGGAGLLVDRADSGSVDSSRLIWMRVDLRPYVPVPIGMTARVAHTHMDSGQNLYCGLAFEFAFNPAHRAFVVDQISRYVGAIQRDQVASARRAG